ncbi:hypothetical protein CLOSTASPAR_00943 [[Clostridium] asparagiforme DSM 15981]|uniref:Uncharacterized protein n=1 Tax=[Clostridium] asparagiforme DSM 15981 TaxID=518636 RepID=C0CVE0_9FIRM|nr:hypothetical protein CLOSTASPAR_00943 [[Clostridium] asparagiforme DSM 15981]
MNADRGASGRYGAAAARAFQPFGEGAVTPVCRSTSPAPGYVRRRAHHKKTFQGNPRKVLNVSANCRS